MGGAVTEEYCLVAEEEFQSDQVDFPVERQVPPEALHSALPFGWVAHLQQFEAAMEVAVQERAWVLANSAVFP